MAKLKPWYQVVTPREDLRDGRPLDASEFAVHLDHIRTGRENVSKDYTDPARFFERTFLTGSLLDLSAQVARRLNGIQVETSAVFVAPMIALVALMNDVQPFILPPCFWF